MRETMTKTDKEPEGRRWIDLHVHSTASDGTTEPELLPQAVLDTIRKHGLADFYDSYIMALTDHDTMAGIDRARKAAAAYPDFQVLPGVEISCDYKGHTIHMLGLGIDPENAPLKERLEYFRRVRDDRNEKILQKFRDLGIMIYMEDIPVAEGETMGRPHIANYLYHQKKVGSIDEAFDLYMKKGRPCHVDREKAGTEEAIRLIKNAGGKAVLAHPMKYRKLGREELEVMIAEMKEAGLQGIETYYTEFTEEEVAYVETLAHRFGLFKTGGSDYHGANKEKIEIGFGWGKLGDTMDKIEIGQAAEMLL